MNDNNWSSLHRDNDDSDREELKSTDILKEINNFMGTYTSLESDIKVETFNQQLKDDPIGLEIKDKTDNDDGLTK